MIPQAISERVNLVVESTRKQLAELKKGDELLPIAHIFGDTGNVVMGFVFRNQQEKELSIQAIAKTARATQADLIVTRMESWTVKLSDDEHEQFNKERAAGKWRHLSEHPKAIEIVTILVDTKENTWIGMSEIIKKETSREMGEVKWGDQAAGIFTGLLRELH